VWGEVTLVTSRVSKLLDQLWRSEDHAVNFFQRNPGFLSMLLNSSFLGGLSPLNASELDGSATWFQTMKYRRVKFRKEYDGTFVAFEKCGCEADANTSRPCRMHQGDAGQAARLKAEARYHSIQNCCQQA
jgi:hypothetical protein